MTISKTVDAIEIIHSTSRRKRWAPIEKHKIVQETYEPGATVSYVRESMVYRPVSYFIWRKVMENGALTSISAEESVVPMSEVNALKKRIRQLERILGQKTLDITRFCGNQSRSGAKKN